MNINKIFLNLIKGIGDPQKCINDFLKTDSGANYNKLLNTLYKNSRFHFVLNNRLFPNSIEIFEFPYYHGIRFEKLLLWDSLIINMYSEHINLFITQKKEFECAILLGNYDEAIAILESVENKFGHSLWILEGKSILSSLGLNMDLNIHSGFERVYLSYLSYKNDKLTRNQYYTNRTKNLIRNNIKEPKIVSFIDFKMFVGKSELNWYDVLFIGSQLSLIDIYLLFSDILQEIETFDVSQKNIETYYKNLSNIEDELIHILYSRHINKELDITDNQLSILTKDFDDDYYKIINEVLLNKNYYVQNIYAYYLLNISSMCLNQNNSFGECLSSDILLALKTIMQKRNFIDVNSSINRLTIISRLLSSFPISKSILSFLNEMQNMDDYLCNSTIFSSYQDIALYNSIIYSNSFLLFPQALKLSSVDKTMSIEYLKWYSNHIITEDHPLYYYHKEAYVALEVRRLINCSNYNNAIGIFMLAYNENALLVFSIDVSRIEEHIKNNYNNRVIPSIEEVCFISIDDHISDYLKSSLLNLLDNKNNIQSDPLSFIENCNADKTIINFFLHKVCTIEMLKKIYWISDSSIAINEYRIMICQHLLNSGTLTNKKEIIDEIEDITKKNIIKNRIQRIDSSRVNIQSNKIQDEVFEEINDLIVRYNNTEKHEKIMVSYDYDSPLYSTYIYLKPTILREIYYTFAKAFCFSDYGIDTSLSTRVRHGAFTNQIINILYNHSLFVNHDDVQSSVFSGYINMHNYYNEVINCFDDLNRSVSNIVEYTKTNILKVTLDENIKDAIFNYDLSPVEEELLFHDLEQYEKICFEDISLVIHKSLITKTNKHLETVRNKVLPDILQKISECLDTFNKNILDYVDDNYSKNSKFINREIIDCKTELQTEINAIKQWFYLSENNTWENYSFDDLLETTNEINKKLFANFSEVVIIPDNIDIVLKGATFRNLVDIFLILFNNAIIHSEYANDLKKLNIHIKTFMNNDKIHLVFSNNLNNTVEVEKIDNKIIELNNKYNSKSYLEINSRQEGGMGLYKIMHIIFSTNQYGKSIHFSRTNNNFNVEIMFGKEIIYDKENSNC